MENLSKCQKEYDDIEKSSAWELLYDKEEYKYDTFIDECLARLEKNRPVENRQGIGRRIYNSLPDVSGRMSRFYNRRRGSQSKGGAGKKRRTKKSKGAKKSKKVKGGKRKGRKTRRYK